jgi:membrane protein DedA with SNARE-associated domain
MTGALAFLFRHAEAMLFAYVFADQVGVPIPAVPVLMAAGGLAAGGRLNLPLALGLSVAASLAADVIWYLAGRVRGSRVLGFLCRVSLEPDSCVRRTETIFLRYGVSTLLVAKFIPGLSTVAPPLAGVVGVGPVPFLLYSAGAALLWASAWMGLGYALGDALERAAVHVGSFGAVLGAALGVAVVLYVAVKWRQRRRFLQSLQMARIEPEELKRKLDAGEDVLVVDVRTALDVQQAPHVIPGAVRLTPEELERRPPAPERAAEVIVYCS